MNFDDFDLNLFRAFDAIYRTKSVSSAAIELNVTQPSMSYSLKRLRDKFQNPLFVRTSKGMTPTPLADALSIRIKEGLKILTRPDQPTVFSTFTTSTNFRIYISDAGMLITLPKVLQRFTREAPQASLSVVDLRPDEVAEALDSGKVDLAVGYFRVMPDWARQQPLRSSSYICAVRKNHSKIREKLTMNDFLAAKHGVYSTSGSSHNNVEQLLLRLKIKRDVVLRIPNFAALVLLIGQSDMVVTLPEDLGFVFSGLANIKLFPPPMPLGKFSIHQYWHERQHESAEFKWFRSIFKGEAANLSATNLPLKIG